MAMTVEQVNEKFAKAKLKFRSYYKYTFAFGATFDGCQIIARLGGNADEIYKLEVKAEAEMDFGKVEDWLTVYVDDAENNLLFDYSSPRW